MKILHTADWHLGQRFYDYDRADEHMDFFGQLLGIVRDERPDALVVAGDVFDTMQPSSQALRLYNNRLLEMRLACPSMTMVVIAGNHDSPTRTEADASLWNELNVNVVGDVAWVGDKVDPTRHLIDVVDGAGRLLGVIAAVPFLRGKNYTWEGDDRPGEDNAPQRLVEHLLGLAARRAGDLPVVAVCHDAVRDRFGGTGDETIGNVYYRNFEDIKGAYDYLALGHIHRPHTLTGSHNRARYSGSPIPMSFDEDYGHSVSLVTLEGHNEPVIEEIALDCLRPALTVPDEPAPIDEALQALAQLPDREGYVRLNVVAEGYLPGDVRERAANLLSGSRLRFCDVKHTDPTRQKAEAARGFTLEEFRQKTPLEIAELFFRQRGETLSDELRTLLNEVINQ